VHWAHRSPALFPGRRRVAFPLQGPCDRAKASRGEYSFRAVRHHGRFPRPLLPGDSQCSGAKFPVRGGDPSADGHIRRRGASWHRSPGGWNTPSCLSRLSSRRASLPVDESSRGAAVCPSGDGRNFDGRGEWGLPSHGRGTGSGVREDDRTGSGCVFRRCALHDSSGNPGRGGEELPRQGGTEVRHHRTGGRLIPDLFLPRHSRDRGDLSSYPGRNSRRPCQAYGPGDARRFRVAEISPSRKREDPEHGACGAWPGRNSFGAEAFRGGTGMGIIRRCGAEASVHRRRAHGGKTVL
jgi:hypothetical protein